MSEIYTITCKNCGKKVKRYTYAVYPGDESMCSECNKKIPFDGEGSKTSVDGEILKEVN